MSWVYFIQGENFGPVKIGHTYRETPWQRLIELQRTSPVRLVVRGQLFGDVVDEKRLHEKFAAHRLYGEWFTPTPEMEEIIRAPLRPKDQSFFRPPVQRTAPGQVLERQGKRGITYAIRFRAYGRREYRTLGRVDEGWTRALAQEVLDDVLADVARGLWDPTL